MSVRPSPTAEYAQYSPRTPTIILSLPPPPPPRPPPRDGQPTASPVRSGHVPVSPPLTINAVSPCGLSTQTPISATSLYGPFSPTYLSSPGPSPRSAVPMAARVSGIYNVPYDPREWIGGSRRASLVLEGRSNGAQAEEGIPNPPPPYSASTAREVTACTSAGSTLSPVDSTFTGGNQSQINTPTSTVGVISPFNQGDSGQNTSNQNAQQYFSPPHGRSSSFDPRPARLSVGSHHPESRPGSSLGVKPPPAMTLSINTAAAQQIIAPRPLIENKDGVGPLPAPPAARRAASAGAVSSHGSSTHSYDGSMSPSSSKPGSWKPGMPLPGPPPGPPPSSSRSQSTSGVRSRASSQAAGSSSRPNSHRIPLRAPILSPMPPTPANWRDESTSRSDPRAPMPLHIETSNLDRPSSTPAGLTRSAALRVTSARGLLERRKQRRSFHDGQAGDTTALTIDTDPWFDTVSPSALSTEQSPTMDSATPGRASPETARRGIRTSSRSGRRFQRSDNENTPFHSPYPPGLLSAGRGNTTPLIPPKALPTPPLSQKNPMSAHSVHPSTASSASELDQGEYDGFMTEASRRHHEFLLRENQASSELERLVLFLEFMVEESKIRRQRYPRPFIEGNFNPEEAKHRLFSEGIEDGRVQLNPTASNMHQSVTNATTIDPQRSEGSWWKDYRPKLSPIASLSNDELSSRGRTPSRWWKSQSGSEDGDAPKKMKRSKRESKYMGLSALSMQEVLSEAATPTNINEVYDSADDKANPKQFGFYSDGEPIPMQDPTPPNPLTPVGLDISRFITLPPPYPRHYPAVNNNHPQLSTYRNIVRTLSDLSDLQSRRSRHHLSVEALRSEHKRKIIEGQKNFRANIQAQINEGSLTYAEAAEAEQALRMEENQSEKMCLKAEFDTLQDVVINPMHDMLNERAAQLTAHLNDLTEKLVAETHAQNLDRPQQEGDAMPEILEYLTQLKWLFETRETIHKEIFDLLSERNDKYKAIVLLPYHQVSNIDKIRDTEDFFTRDSLQRRRAFYDEAVKRYESFVKLVSEHVGEELDLQSSAFWDIAPGLLQLVQKLPDEMNHLGPIAIPDAEYVENPAYHEFPQQYLYTLLDHAEKSTYQFIESQINLHCLLHEVKGSLLGAKRRAAEAGRARDELDCPGSGDGSQKICEEQEASATAELKQHVSMIEEQWLEALGSALQGKKAQVKMYLESVGGWDESLQAGE